MKLSRRHFFLSFLAVPVVGVLGFVGKKPSIVALCDLNEIAWYYEDIDKWIFKERMATYFSIMFDLTNTPKELLEPDHICWQGIPREYLPFYDVRCVPDERFEELVNNPPVDRPHYV